jgi:hypothetical protein
VTKTDPKPVAYILKPSLSPSGQAYLLVAMTKSSDDFIKDQHYIVPLSELMQPFWKVNLGLYAADIMW